MFLLEWYEKWLEIRETHAIPKVCESCETLKSQLAYANHEKEILLSKIMEKPEPVMERATAPPMEHKSIRPTLHMPWKVKQQMLEANDREKARAMRDAPKPDAAEVAEFEKEVKDAERAREASTGSPS